MSDDEDFESWIECPYCGARGDRDDEHETLSMGRAGEWVEVEQLCGWCHNSFVCELLIRVECRPLRDDEVTVDDQGRAAGAAG